MCCLIWLFLLAQKYREASILEFIRLKFSTPALCSTVATHFLSFFHTYSSFWFSTNFFFFNFHCISFKESLLLMCFMPKCWDFFSMQKPHCSTSEECIPAWAMATWQECALSLVWLGVWSQITQLSSLSIFSLSTELLFDLLWPINVKVFLTMLEQ